MKFNHPKKHIIITITFVYNDKISGQIVCDDKSICHISHQKGYGNYRISDDSQIYETALNVYKDVKAQY